MKTISLVLGVFFLLGSVIFVAQEIYFAAEIDDRPETAAETLSVAYLDFPGRSAFLALHPWMVWHGLAVWLSGVDQNTRFHVGLIGLAMLLLLVGHMLAVWLAWNGVNVGLFY